VDGSILAYFKVILNYLDGKYEKEIFRRCVMGMRFESGTFRIKPAEGVA